MLASWPFPWFLHYVHNRCLLRRRICFLPLWHIRRSPFSAFCTMYVISAYCGVAFVLLPLLSPLLCLMYYARRRYSLKRVVHRVSVILLCTSPLFSVGHPCAFAYVISPQFFVSELPIGMALYSAKFPEFNDINVLLVFPGPTFVHDRPL